MCLFLSIGFTWIPSVYKLFSLGAPQLEGFSVSQSVQLHGSLHGLITCAVLQEKSLCGLFKMAYPPTSSLSLLLLLFHNYLSSLIASGTMVSGKELCRATGSATQQYSTNENPCLSRSNFLANLMHGHSDSSWSGSSLPGNYRAKNFSSFILLRANQTIIYYKLYLSIIIKLLRILFLHFCCKIVYSL